MGWADGLADGLSSGIQLGNSIQRNQAMRQEQEWKAEDRQRETDERKQLDELGKVMGTIERGDFSPAIAKANSSGQFGPDRYAAGARVGEDGLVYANVYDNKDPVNSMQEVKLGKLQDVKNQVFMANAPPSVVAKLALAQAQNQMNPQYQQQVQAGALDLKKKEFEVNNQPTNQATDTAIRYAQLGSTLANTANTQQNMQYQAQAQPSALDKARADAKRAQWLADNPRADQALATETTFPTADSQVTRKIFNPNDPALQQAAGLAGQNAGQAPAQQQAAPAQQPTQSAAPAAKTAAPQQQQKKTLNSDTIKQYLLKAGGDTKKARAMAESEGWSF